jgi:hypothetical protein
LQALSLFKDTHLQKLELLSNSTTIEQALQFIKSKQEQQEQQESEQPEQDDNNDNSDDVHLSTGRQSVFLVVVKKPLRWKEK